MKFRDIREAPKTAVLAFGRMNPPTIGHKKLADKVASLPGDPYIFVSQSQKPKTDPLSFQDKLKYAKASFPGVTVGSSDVKTIIQALQKIEAMGYDSIIYVAGSDRIQDFTNLINKYNGKEYNFNNIEVVSAGERDPDAEGAEGMSASKMRAAAAAGDFDSFKQGVANPKIAQQMFTDVRKGMGITEILGFATKHPKRATIKKKPEKFEPSVQDKIAARRKAAAKGDKNAWKSGVKTLEGAMKRMATSLANKADRTASTNKLKPGLDTYKKKPKKTNEAYKLQLERGKEMDVLHIVDTKTGGRTEVRGKPGYESGNYDSNDRLHMLLDKVGRSANISELINGEVVSINPKHPDAAKAKSATDVAYNESTELDSLRKFVKSQREAPDQVLYQMMMAPDTYGHAASNFVRSWYEKTKEENGLNDVDSALEIMVDELGLNENFADGKVKGKSRPGRVKRSGASCNGSVTDLRKRAKNSSGEKARMYHWCANMKSGRKKK
jgi:nicotinic acid mononucleotide adenylyltransferase